MAHFETTTQAKYWLFTREQVAEMRKNVHEEASKRLKERVNSTEIEPLSLEEETKLRRIHEIKIQKNAEKLGLPEKVQATAVTLFKRYFLKTSVMEASPITMALTCLYLACKIDEYYIPFKEYITAVDADLTVEQLLSFEMEVMQKLEFHITCYHPYLSFSALLSFLEEESWWNTKANQVDKKKLYRYARSLIHTSLLTDLMFYLTPGQIALGILSYAFSHFHLSFPLDCFLKLKDENKETRVTNDEEWLSLWEQAIAVLKREMSTCGGLYTWNISSGDETQQLLKKLSLCMDPRVDPTSAEYFAMIKKKEDMKEMRRLEKNRAFAERRKREFAMITGIGEELSQENNLKEDSELQPEDLSKKLEKPQESELDETNKKRRTRE